MTIQEAIESYNTINSYLTILLIIFGSGMMVFGLVGAGNLDNLKGASKFQKGSLVAAIVGVLLMLTSIHQEFFENPTELAKWEEVVREEYVNKLPIEKIEILDYKGIGQKVNDNQLKIEFTYLNQNIKTVDTTVATIKSVKYLKSPYLEYQYIESNLPQNGEEIIFEKGYHNPVLYIPE